MATTTEFIETQNTSRVLSGIATIDDEESSTLDIPCGGRAVVRLGVPTLDAATLTFTVQAYPGAAFRTLVNEQGGTITVPSSTGAFAIQIPALSGVYAFRIVTGAAQMGGPRLIEVQCVGDSPIPIASFVLTDEIA